MRFFAVVVSLFVFASQAEVPSRAVPEAFTGLNYQKAAYGEKAMVSAANPHAVNAGLEMLKKGGNAIDAAVAIQLVLTLVEPQSSGIGGGAFLLWFDGQTKSLTTFDGREKAPSAATPDLFLDKDGKPVRWIDAVIGGRSVGVPGILKMMETVHNDKGKLPWEDLFGPAIKLAEEGFVVSPRLSKLVSMKMNPGLSKLSPAKEYFYPNGVAIKAGQKLINKPYAETLKLISKDGTKAFYQGILAKNMVSAVQNSEVAPGLLSLNDLRNYTAVERPPVCIDYKAPDDVYQVCSMGPPSSGGITVLQILKLLEPYELEKSDVQSLETVHLYSQAAKLAFADRDKYMADSDFVNVPSEALLSDAYTKQRRAEISQTTDMGRALPGEVGQGLVANNVSVEQPNTTHMSIIDEYGNAVSMTSSIEMGFGSTVMVDGYLLNNQLTDFSLRPEVNGFPVANRVEGNKRPRSSMTPVIVLKDGQVHAVIGSPGGSRIINYVGYALVALLDYGIDLQKIVDMPRISNRNGKTTLEKVDGMDELAEGLSKMGHEVTLRSLTSGIHAIVKTKKGWQGAADPRREGTATGY